MLVYTSTSLLPIWSDTTLKKRLFLPRPRVELKLAYKWATSIGSHFSRYDETVSQGFKTTVEWRWTDCYWGKVGSLWIHGSDLLSTRSFAVWRHNNSFASWAKDVVHLVEERKVCLAKSRPCWKESNVCALEPVIVETLKGTLKWHVIFASLNECEIQWKSASLLLLD